MCHVLIIEDESLIAMDIEAILIDGGATSVSFAATEDDAVREARARRPLVITSDVTLLAGTGPRAVRSIRDDLGMIPVLFVTGTPHLCSPIEPGDAVFDKPINRSGLEKAFRSILADSKLAEGQ